MKCKAMPRYESSGTYGTTNQLTTSLPFKSLNRLIQSSAADQSKAATVDLYKSGVVPLLQIHDELACSVESAEQAQDIARIMEQALPLRVPNKCDIDLGPSWGEAKPL